MIGCNILVIRHSQDAYYNELTNLKYTNNQWGEMVAENHPKPMLTRFNDNV